MLTMLFLAQTLAPAACTPAGSSLRVSARVTSFKPADVTYVVVNRGHDSLHWITLNVQRPLEVNPSAQFLKMPLDWRAGIVPASNGQDVSVTWTALSDDAAVGPAGSASFGLRGAQRYGVRQGTTPLDFTALPFTAGDAAGHCWSGITDSAEYSDMGVSSGIVAGTARVLSDRGTTRVLVAFPAGEVHLRFSDHASLVVPLALTWGVKGGFSLDGSIGIGLSWTPTKYVSASATTNIGTLLFNNVTHLRTVGIDLNIPIGRTTFAEGLSRQSRFLVVGVEYYQRSVSKLAGFLDGPQWYASGRGVALRIGIKNVSWSWGP